MRYGSAKALVSQGFTTIVPAQEFVTDETYQDFMLWRCTSEAKFLKALSTVKIDDKTTLADEIKTAEHVRKLATYSDSKEDKVKWGVSIKSLLGSIRFDDNELKKAECQIGFSNSVPK